MKTESNATANQEAQAGCFQRVVSSPYFWIVFCAGFALWSAIDLLKAGGRVVDVICLPLQILGLALSIERAAND